MENTQTQKTPEQWFMQLKEPYRSEAIKGINKEVLGFQEYPKSLSEALYFSLHWGKPHETTRSDWDVIYGSIHSGETTYLEHDNVSLINEVNNSQVPEQQKEKWSEKIDEIIDTHVVQKLKPEPIELRPEDLVKGDVYTLTVNNNKILKYTFCHDRFDKELNRIYYISFYGHKYDNFKVNDYMEYSKGNDKIRLATPEESASLSRKKLTDWESKYNELKAKYDQLEPKGEKVYFYHDGISWSYSKSLDDILVASRENYEIYEAVCIGKKKSVLVNE